MGDYDNDGKAEIITVPGPGGGPHVRIFNEAGQVKRQFFADALHDRGGLSVALGNLDGDDNNEIIIGLGMNRDPIVKVFNAQAKLTAAFYVLPKSYQGGVNVAAASLYGRSSKQRDSLIIAPAGNFRPVVRIFDNLGRMHKEFLAYGENWRGGINIAAGDISNDGIAEIITGVKAGATPHVRVFERDGSLVSSFFAYADDFKGGVNVGLMRFNK